MPSQFFDLDDSTTLHVSINTPAQTNLSAGPALIFLHYWGGSTRTWQRVASLMPSRTTIAIDHRGWGQSKGADSAHAYGITQLRDDVLQLLPLLNVHTPNGFVLVGHSMGAKVAMAVAARAPAGLKAVLLVAPAPPTPLVLSPAMQSQQQHAYDSPESVRFVVQTVLSRPENISPADLDVIVEDSLRGNRFAKAAWPAYGMAEDISADLARIEVPVSILVAEEDRVEAPKRVEKEIAARLREVGVLRGFSSVEACGHLIPIERPGVIVGAVEALLEGLE